MEPEKFARVKVVLSEAENFSGASISKPRRIPVGYKYGSGLIYLAWGSILGSSGEMTKVHSACLPKQK